MLLQGFSIKEKLALLNKNLPHPNLASFFSQRFFSGLDAWEVGGTLALLAWPLYPTRTGSYFTYGKVLALPNFAKDKAQPLAFSGLENIASESVIRLS